MERVGGELGERSRVPAPKRRENCEFEASTGYTVRPREGGGGSELPGSTRLSKIWASIKRTVCRKNDDTGNGLKGFSCQAKGMELYSGGMSKSFERVNNSVR